MLSKIKILSLAYLFILLASCQVTPEISIHSEATETSSPEPLLTATLALTSTPVAETVVFEENKSPNGEWIGKVTVTTQGINKNVKFSLVNNITGQNWLIENRDFLEPENPLEGFEYPYIFKWSEDGQHLFYSHLSTGGDGCYVTHKPGGFDFHRFDLATGEDIILQATGGTQLALSPDEKKLAYVQNWDSQLTILDFENKNMQVIPLLTITEVQGLVDTIDHILWSPDRTHLVYSYSWGDCGDYFVSNIIILELDTLSQIFLVENNRNGYIPIEWAKKEQILIKDNEDNQWWLNVTTKEIIPVNK